MSDPIDLEEVRKIQIVFDGPPGPEAGRFVEVENMEGHGLRRGEWVERDDGYWALVLPDSIRLADEVERQAKEIERLVKSNEHWHQRVSHLKTRNDAWDKEDRRLREALEFYAKRESWSYYPGRGDRFEASIVGMDWGDIARAALKGEG